MKQIKNGIDLVQISRIDQSIQELGDRFLNRIYTEAEITYCQKKKNAAESFAARFAAKEAVSKALGTGIGPYGVSFKQIEVQAIQGKAPNICLYDKTYEYFKMQGGQSIAISLSHDGDYAIAFCIIEFEEK